MYSYSSQKLIKFDTDPEPDSYPDPEPDNKPDPSPYPDIDVFGFKPLCYDQFNSSSVSKQPVSKDLDNDPDPNPEPISYPVPGTDPGIESPPVLFLFLILFPVLILILILVLIQTDHVLKLSLILLTSV